MPNIIEVARKEGGFSTLLKAADVAGLLDTLSNDGPFTFFAPTDEAFSKLPSETLNELLNEPEKLKLDPFKHLINDEAQFVKPDVEADNGVIHIIDAVLMPS